MSRMSFLEGLLKAAKENPELAAKLKRAEEMGFDTSEVYLHGSTRSDIGKGGNEFKASDGIFGKGVYFTKDPSESQTYSMKKKEELLSAKNMAENPNSPWRATDVPGYNKEWGQTTYPVFLKKPDLDIIRDELNPEFKAKVLEKYKEVKKQYPSIQMDHVINDIKRSEDNYHLMDGARTHIPAEELSKLLNDININRVNLPHDNTMVINPEENVKSVFADFKNKKGLMSAFAPIGAAGVEINPVSTLKEMYSAYKDSQREISEPAAKYLASQLDLGAGVGSPGLSSEAVKAVTTEGLDPLNYTAVGDVAALIDLLGKKNGK